MEPIGWRNACGAGGRGGARRDGRLKLGRSLDPALPLYPAASLLPPSGPFPSVPFRPVPSGGGSKEESETDGDKTKDKDTSKQKGTDKSKGKGGKEGKGGKVEGPNKKARKS